MPKAKQTIVLEKLPNKSQQQIKQVLFYPEDTAGGIMQVECAKVSINATIADAIATVRRLVEQDVEILAVWVVRDDNFLLGSIPLADLLLQKANVPVKKVLEPIIASATPLIDQENVADLFKKYDLITLPVVNSKNQLLGRIVIDDIIDVVAEEAEEDALHMGGTSVEELHHTTQPFTTAKIRFPWLLVTLLFSFISTSIVALFGPLIEKAVIISVFYPLITAMGGNVGTQSATTLIRAIATNRIKITDIPMYFIKEIGVGVLLGVTCGVGAGLFAAIILSNGNYALGLVVLISMTLSMTAAACMGVIAPTLLRKFNIDPAIASGPFVTTLIDIIGILIYMLTAFYFIDYL